MTVAQAVKAYLDDLRENERAPGTIESAEDRLEMLLDVDTNGSKPLKWIAPRGAQLYKAARTTPLARTGKPPVSDTHINALFVGKTWGDFLVERKLLRANPFAAVKPVGRKRKGADKERLTNDESRRLMDWCLAHARDRGAVLTLGYLLLGTRATELVARDVRDLDDGGGLLRIGATKTEAGRRSFAVPDVLAKLLARLARGKDAGDRLFDGWTRHAAYNHVRRVCAAAGVPVVSPQALRRTQSDLATDAGVAALAVAAHLGHAGTQVTHRSYVNANVRRSAQVRRAASRLATPVATRPKRRKRRKRSKS